MQMHNGCHGGHILIFYSFPTVIRIPHGVWSKHKAFLLAKSRSAKFVTFCTGCCCNRDEN